MKAIYDAAVGAIWLTAILFVFSIVAWLVDWMPGWLFAIIAVVCVVAAFYLLGVINEQQKVLP